MIPAILRSDSDKRSVAWLAAVGGMIVVLSVVGWAALKGPSTPIPEKEQLKEQEGPSASKPVETVPMLEKRPQEQEEPSASKPVETVPMLEKRPQEQAEPGTSKPVETVPERTTPPATQLPADLPPLPRPRPPIRVPKK